jgi:predicted acyl esterase
MVVRSDNRSATKPYGQGDATARIEFYRDMVRHPTYDEFWTSYSVRDKYAEVDQPAYFITGWYVPWATKSLSADLNINLLKYLKYEYSCL